MRLIVFTTLLCVTVWVHAQDSLKIEAVKTDTLVENASNVDTTVIADNVSLLPEHYLFTQRLLWSEKGLMRNFKAFELSTDARNREMNIRSHATAAHQYLGYASLVGMIASGITGQDLYKGEKKQRNMHDGFVAFTNICYFSTAALALFQPPPMHDRESGFTKLRIHQTLSIVHLSSMIATNVLGGLLEHNPNLKPYHRAAAITAFSSLFLATVVIKL
jgi:hypothetical protein